MQIGIEVAGDVLMLRLSGRFTAGAEAEYQRAKVEIQKAGSCKVLLDFAEVPYIDSTGLAFLVGLYHTVRNLHGRMVLSQVCPRVRDVLELTRLNRVFPTFENSEEALTALSQWERMRVAAMAY